MSDDPKPPPPPPPVRPLGYWHPSNPPSPPHEPELQTLVAVGGFLVGAVVVVALGFLVGVGLAGANILEIDTPKPQPLLGWAVGLPIDLATVFIFCVLIRKLRRERVWPLWQRYRRARLFAVGFLLGCGVACLVEGICYTSAGF